MAGFYQTFVSPRTTEPNWDALLDLLHALDTSAGLQHQIGSQTYIIKKNTAWLTGHINAAQNAIDTAPVNTPQLAAQYSIDRFTIVDKAIILTILDQFNVIRAALVPPLQPITVNQMIAAIRTKAGTL